MRRPPLILWGASVTAWALTGAATAGGARTRVWLCSLGVSLVSTNAAVMASAVTGRVDRAYVAMAKAFATRPDDGERLAKVIVGALAEVSRPDASTASPGPRKTAPGHEVVVPFPVRQKS